MTAAFSNSGPARGFNTSAIVTCLDQGEVGCDRHGRPLDDDEMRDADHCICGSEVREMQPEEFRRG